MKYARYNSVQLDPECTCDNLISGERRSAMNDSAIFAILFAILV